MKTCTKCGRTKSLEDFHRNKNSDDGRYTICKSCRNSAKWNEEANNPGYKRCTGCKELLPLDEFYKIKSDRRKSECKSCQSKRLKQYRADNKDAIKEQTAQYKKDNAELLRQRRLDDYWADPEASRAKARERHHENKERNNRWNRRYYCNNRDEQVERVKQYQRDHREELNAATRARNATPEGRAKKRQRDANRRSLFASQQGEVTITLEELAMMQCDKCYYCGIPFGEGNSRVTLEHLDPLARGGLHDDMNVVAACSSCNSSKCDKNDLEYFEYLRRIKRTA